MAKPHARWATGCGTTVVLLVGAWFAIGGLYGVELLLGGKNPFSYVAPTPDRIEETRDRAEKVIAALERWKSAHGEYPTTLTDLVPSELAEVPRPVVGDRRWRYTRPKPSAFVLDFFEGPLYEHTWWDSAESRWNGDH